MTTTITSPTTTPSVADVLAGRRSAILSRRQAPKAERVADPNDQAVTVYDNERAAMELCRDRALLKQIDHALDRVQAGEYGICVECENPIPAKRLAAAPEATRCVRCQEAVERGGQAEADSPAAGLDHPTRGQPSKHRSEMMEAV